MHKFKDANEIGALVDDLKSKGKTIGLSHGVFDLVHPGHIQHFIAAKKEVDYLIVSITADNFVNKGPGRPIFNQEIRISTLSALEAVDFVTISNNKTAENLINIIKPNIYFKGSDYKDSADDPTGKIDDERKVVEANGGILNFTNELTSSSSKLINNYFNQYSEITQKWLTKVKEKYSLNDIDGYLHQISNLNVSLVGEIIIDEYTHVNALAKSSKDPILAFHLLDKSSYAGGILAIANNCASWVKSVTVYSTIRENDVRPVELAKMLNQNIHLKVIHTERPTITKHRYVDIGTKTKVFETYEYKPEDLSKQEIEKFLATLIDINSADLVLIADYGHGLLNQDLISFITRESKYLAVNTQSNAGNRGFNTLSKYSKMDFFTVNSGELQLELRSKSPNFEEILPTMLAKFDADKACLTLGAEGMFIFNKHTFEAAPALATRVIDKVGAGDSVFAISSLLAFVDAPLAIIGLVANLVAAHEVQQLGHQTSLTLGDIRKQIKAMLG